MIYFLQGLRESKINSLDLAAKESAIFTGSEIKYRTPKIVYLRSSWAQALVFHND